ncbi:MAG: acyltransferase, partial [Bacteroidetes bacterium]|nr:acyltransferase [Bacteroidota bacterium]
PNVSVIGPISIGDYSYIAAQSVLLPGLKIGRNVVVSAGSLVNRDMADYESFPG